MARGQDLMEHILQTLIMPGALDYASEICRVGLHRMHGGHQALANLGQIERFLRELHGPRDSGSATIKLAVDEIRAAAKKQANRRDDRNIVSKTKPRNTV